MSDNPDEPSAEVDTDTEASTNQASPDASGADAELFGHPQGLFYLFFAELWERFSFYGMRALLTLYLANELFSDLANGKDVAYEIYAAYGSLVYFTPALGGMIADRLIGHKNSILLGALLMCIGHFTMAFQNETIFYLSLGLLIVGNGFFKPNISSLVGGLYRENDPRRDGGFTIFYLGINLGAFLSPLVCGYLGEKYGWHYGFSAAGIGMFVGMVVFWIGGQKGIYGDQGNQPLIYQEKSYGGLNIRHIVWFLSFLSAPVFALLVRSSEFSLLGTVGLLQFLLISLLVLVLIYITYECFNSDKVTRERLMVIVVLTFFITVFWAFFEQAGSSLTLFAEEQVNLFGLNASQTNAINPFYIVVLAIPFSMMWNRLELAGTNPNTMIKFGLGIGQLGLGFLVFALSARFCDDAGKVSMMFLLIGYLLITSGELFLSPIGLSKVTELSPAKLVAFMMGVWFLSSSFAHYIAGVIAKLTTGGAGGSPLDGIVNTITGAAPATATEGVSNLFNYTNVFAQIAIVSFAIALLALLISPVIKRMMHGVR